ncbi:hypothetical protein [Demequina sp. NBRC 110054]|uniref:hypothetical protein n=1 Tax=Demequina sp. NBRC 110054 TaxID=1570343 RepID=UPI001177A9C4|nr:hypothetical protein [Demequina sp. NBRC 110054]
MSDLGDVLHDGADRVGGRIAARGDKSARAAAAWRRITARRRRRAAWYAAGSVSAFAVVAVVASGLGGRAFDAAPVQPAGSAGACVRGESSVDAAARAFFEAVQAGDVDAVTSELVVGREADDASVTELQEVIGDASVDGFTLSTSQPGGVTRYVLDVSTSDGADLGQYEIGEMVDQDPGCFGVVWGESLEVDPSASMTPSASTFRGEVATMVFPEDAPTAGVGIAGDLEFADGCVYIDLVGSATAEENGVEVGVDEPLILMLPEDSFSYDGSTLTFSRFSRSETFEDGDRLVAGGTVRVLANVSVEHSVPAGCTGDGVLLLTGW